MKIVFYGGEKVGMASLLTLLARRNERNYDIIVIREDPLIEKIAVIFNLETISFEDINKTSFNLLVCVHGDKLIPKNILDEHLDACINIHPCLYKYKGNHPVERYIQNKDMYGSVGCHFMTETPDTGDVLLELFFDTPVLSCCEEFYMLALPYYVEIVDRVVNNFYYFIW
jgi:hypothetical protein